MVKTELGMALLKGLGARSPPLFFIHPNPSQAFSSAPSEVPRPPEGRRRTGLAPFFAKDMMRYILAIEEILVQVEGSDPQNPKNQPASSGAVWAGRRQDVPGNGGLRGAQRICLGSLGNRRTCDRGRKKEQEHCRMCFSCVLCCSLTC